MKQISVIVLAAIFCLNSCTQPTSTEKSQTVEIKNNGVKIAFSDNRKGDTTLLFVHGWCINKSYWTSQMDYFKDKYRIVAIDLPGYGASGKNRNKWDTDTFASDVNAIISQLQLKNVILIGHSMSGDIVLQAALKNPKYVIGIVGVDNFKMTGVPQPSSATAEKEYEDAINAMKKDFKKVAKDYFKQSLFYKTTADSIKNRILKDIAKTDPRPAIASMEQGNIDEAKQLKGYKKTLYLINSDYEMNDTSGLKKHKIPFDLHIIPDVGHFPMIENPNDFNKHLAMIIAKI